MMQPMRWLAFASGLVVVALTWSSLVATFVSPRGRSIFQRASALVHRSVHSAVVELTRLTPDYTRKDSLLAAVAPLSLVLQLAAFLGAFVLGATLQLLPWVGSWGVAVRQAAGAIFVVGLVGDAGPTDNVIRVLAAATGAVTIALQIGYLPVIYQAYARREALVALMESRAGVPAWGPEVIMRHLLVDAMDSLGGFYGDWEAWSAELAESHGTHPVLVLFRSAEVGYSWILALLAVLDASALHVSLCPSTAPTEARMCLRMGFTALRRLATTLGWRYDPDPSPLGPLQLDYAAFEAAVAQLVSSGLVIERSTEDAWAHFQGWRVNYESISYRFADYLVAPHAPWSGPRKHLPPDVVPPERPPHRSPDGAMVEDNWLRQP